MSSITGISAAARISADLFAASAPAQSASGKLGHVAIDDCGTVPHKFPFPPPPPPFSSLVPSRLVDGWCGTVPHKLPPPPPPSPFSSLVPSRLIDEWCGTVPRKFPFPPPPPPPWVDGINQMLGTR